MCVKNARKQGNNFSHLAFNTMMMKSERNSNDAAPF